MHGNVRYAVNQYKRELALIARNVVKEWGRKNWSKHCWDLM